LKDISVIPHGSYCYTFIGDSRKGENRCPYWKHRPVRRGKKLHSQEDGYCTYLDKGDYELNRELKYTLEWPEDHECIGIPMTAEEIGMPFSLLWDLVKMCGENDYDEWEIYMDIGVYGI